MKVTLPDSTLFNIKEVHIAQEPCLLITPKEMGVVWTEENKIFRSSIWRKSDMTPVSLGFKKFTNLGESPEFEPFVGYEDLEFVRKIDGSLGILSFWKNEVIFRTRGTVDASSLANGTEVNILKEKYPKAFQMNNDSSFCAHEHSFLFEWTTPTNRIVLNETAEPTLWLIGAVRHKDYSYWTQRELDVLAEKLNVERPKRFQMNLVEIQQFLQTNESIEGIVIYANKGQLLKKIKTPRYLYLHRVFTGIKTVDHLFELFVRYCAPERAQFEKQLVVDFDYELILTLKDLMNDMYNRWSLIEKFLNKARLFLQDERFIKLERKDRAALISKQYTNLSGIVFGLMDNKPIQYLKLWKAIPQIQEHASD